MTDINYHLELQGKSFENFMKWLDLQILVKEYAKTRYKARKFTQK